MGKITRKSVDVRRTLAAGIFCGCIGVLVDFDHVLKIILFPEKDWRFLHKPILIISCIALCCLGAYLGGLYFRYILRKKDSGHRES